MRLCPVGETTVTACSLVWRTIQNAAARVLIRSRKYDHISSVLRSLHLLPDTQKIDFKTALLVYKSLLGPAPKYLSDMLEPDEAAGTLKNSGSGLKMVSRVRTKLGEASFQFHAPKIWISLPEQVRQAPSLTVLNPGWKRFCLTVGVETGCILSAPFTFHLSNFYYLFFLVFLLLNSLWSTLNCLVHEMFYTNKLALPKQ